MFTQFKIRPLLNELRYIWNWKRFKPFSIRSLTTLFAIGLSVSLIVSSCSSNPPVNTAASPEATSAATSAPINSAIEATTVRIGFQKAATVLFLLKSKGTLEKLLEPAGVKVTWTEFPAGPPLLEALNADSIDFGFTGEAPPIFAQAGGVPVRYVAYDPYGVQSEAIIVKKDSPIQKLEDLKGKKVGVAKGSNTHYLLLSALQSVGLTVNDIQFVFLKPGDARAAFEGNNIDAWSIWDPYLAVAEVESGARILTNAKGLAPNIGYYQASQSFVEKSPNALKAILDEVKKENEWAKSNSTEVAKTLEPVLGIKAAILEKAENRREYGLAPITNEVITKQQKIADTFASIKLIPKSIKVEEAVWAWKPQG